MSRGQGPEHVLGSINVSAEIRAGSESLRMFFTEKRLIMAHIGKRGMGSATGTTLLGRLGAGFEGFLRSPAESARKRKTETSARDLDPEEILRVSPDNFAIRYEEIVEVSLERTPYSVEIVMLTGDDKYRLSTREDSAKVLSLFQGPLTTRVKVKDRDHGQIRH